MDNNIIETNQILIRIDKDKSSNIKRILDIGGGGEGIISKLYQEKVIAIDIREDELFEMPKSNSLKLVMDATNLTFVDNQFDIITAFYSFMYMTNLEIEMVLKEAFRVLKPDGILEIWDIEMPSINEVHEDVFIAQLELNVEDELITTGYGVQLKDELRDLNYYQHKLEDKLFHVIEHNKGINGDLYIKAVRREKIC